LGCQQGESGRNGPVQIKKFRNPKKSGRLDQRGSISACIKGKGGFLTPEEKNNSPD